MNVSLANSGVPLVMFIPRIKDREYLVAEIGKTGKVKRHACCRCGRIYPAAEKGAWFERADVRGKWQWVCQTCCAVRGIYVG